MPNFFLTILAFIALCVAITLGLMHEAQSQVFCQRGLQLAEATAYMKDKHSEVPAMIAPLTDNDTASFLVFANPDTRTWTTFVLHANGCANEIRYLNGTGWPFAVPNSGAGNDAKVAP